MPTDDGLLTQLCERWEAARACGESVTPEDLCREHPELLGELRRAVHHLAAADRAVAAPAPGGDPYPDLPSLPDGCRYRLVQFLAQGGLGRVYAGEDLELGREVAVKFVRPDRASAAALARFRREAEVTGRLEHPGVAPVYGLVELPDGGFCYAMRLLRGETLSAAIDRLPAADHPDRPAALRKLLRHFIAVCDAVAFAHSRGVLHRDLKPANVMLGEFGETWVLDWGLARPASGPGGSEADAPPTHAGGSGGTPSPGQTVPGSAVGTPGFMSPEQARGEAAAVGPASDVYGLGATLGAILTGRGPQPGESAGQWLVGVRPAALAAVCMKALSADPADRYATAADLAADVERWLADEPVTAYRDPFPERARRWAKRNRAAVVGMGALLLAAVPLSVALAAVSDQARRQAVNDQKRIEKEKEEADRQRDAARRERDEADRQRTAATANFDLAFRVMDDTFRTISEDINFRNFNLLPLRKEIEARLRTYFSDLATRYRDDPKLREYTSVALLNSALLERAEGREDSARKLLEEAEATARKLAAESPARVEYKIRLAAVLTAVAMQRSQVGEDARAAPNFREAVGLWEQAASAQPENIKCHAGLGAARAASATHLIRTGKFDAAVEEITKAIAEAEANERRPGWPPLQSMHGNLYGLLGQAHRQADRPREAEAAYREAVKQHDRVLEKNPGDVFTAYLRAAAELELGQFYLQFAANDPAAVKKAGEVLDRAAATLGKLTRENPTQWPYAHDYLMARYYRAQIAQASDTSRAASLWAEALELAEASAERFPEVAKFNELRLIFKVRVANHDANASKTDRAVEAWSSVVREGPSLLKPGATAEAEYGLRTSILEAGYGLGLVHFQAQRYDLAESALRPAVETGHGIFRSAAPPPPPTVIGFATTCGLLGETLARKKNHADAERAYARGVEAVHRLPAATRSLPSVKQTLAMLQTGRANALGALAKYEEEAEVWNAIAPEAAGGERAHAEFRRALARLRAGQVAAGLEEIERAAVPQDAHAAFQYDIACVLALAADVVETHPEIPHDRREKLASDYRTQAVQLLEKAHAGGFFKDAAVVSHFKSDADLNSLRKRPDYQKLLAAIEAAAKK